MAIDKELWQRAKALFEIGKSLNEISEATGINKSSISKRAKLEGWQKGKNQPLVEENIQARQNVEIAKNKIQQQIQHPVEQAEIEKVIDERLAIVNSITNLDKGTLSCHNIILKKTLAKVTTGELSEVEASRVLANQGLSIDKIAGRAGIGQPTTAIQINNIENKIPDTLPDDPIEASRVYMELMRNGQNRR